MNNVVKVVFISLVFALGACSGGGGGGGGDNPPRVVDPTPNPNPSPNPNPNPGSDPGPGQGNPDPDAGSNPTTSVVAFAWVGKNQSTLTMPASLNGSELFVYRDVNCDIDNFDSCASPKQRIIVDSDKTETNTALTLDTASFLQSKKDANKSPQQLVSVTKFVPRMGADVTEFNNKLWLFGGFNSQYQNDVWTSTDGFSWAKVEQKQPVSLRAYQQLVSFKGKLWVIGGEFGSKVGDKISLVGFDEVWSSPDGATWTKETDSAAFGSRTRSQVVNFKGKLWLIAGIEGAKGVQNDVWSSEDGVTWTKVQADAPFVARFGHRVLVFNDKMWVLGGTPGDKTQALNDVWSSADGVNWTLESVSGLTGAVSAGVQTTAGKPFTARYGHGAAVYKGKMWVTAGYGGTFKTPEGKPAGAQFLRSIWSSTDGKTWTEESSETPPANKPMFTPRLDHMTMSFNDRLFVVAGVEPALISKSNVTQVARSDIWASLDGQTWYQPYPLNRAGDKVFSARTAHQSVKFNNKLWVIGGLDTQDRNDVWSSTDSQVWTKETANAAFSARSAHQVLVFNNRLWVIGGVTGSNTSQSDLSDVWYSDDGITWTEATGARFSPRRHHRAVVKTVDGQEKMFVIGGVQGTETRLNDVWSSTDGGTWIQETSDAGFVKRSSHAAVVYDDKIWVIAGRFGTDKAGTDKNDVWSSPDGKTWTQVTSSAAFEARRSLQVVDFKGKLTLVAGRGYNDVWTSSDGKDWTKVGVIGLANRYSHQVVVDGDNLWVVGGLAGSAWSNDVWRSKDGVNWEVGIEVRQ